MKIIILIFLIIFLFVVYYVYFRELYSTNNKYVGNTNLEYDKLMIIAHPDDELIFGSNLLLKYPRWKVVCITNGSYNSMNKFTLFLTDRKKEFIDSMNTFKCSYEIWDYEDNKYNSNWNKNMITKQLNDLINEKNYDMIITHNLQGEYGNLQHKKISEIVHSLKPKNLYVFKKDKSRLNPYYSRALQLCKVYKSQRHIIKDHDDYIKYQSFQKINTI